MILLWYDRVIIAGFLVACLAIRLALRRRAGRDTGGPGWKPVRESLGQEAPAETEGPITRSLLNVLLGCIAIYALLFAAGSAVYGEVLRSGVLFVLALAAGTPVVVRVIRSSPTT